MLPSNEQVQTMLKIHKLWVMGEPRGIPIHSFGMSLYSANLQNACLSRALLKDMNLSKADLTSALLNDANLRGAIMADCNLSGANLKGALLQDVDFRGARFFNVDLEGSIIDNININNAYDIISFGPIGDDRIIGYAVRHTLTTMYYVDRVWANFNDTLLRISNKYGEKSPYVLMIVCAAETLKAQYESINRQLTKE